VPYFLVQAIRNWTFTLGMTFGAAVLAAAVVLLIPSKYTLGQKDDTGSYR